MKQLIIISLFIQSFISASLTDQNLINKEANHQKTKQPQTDQNLISKEANHQKTKQPQTDQNLISKEANHQKTKQPQTDQNLINKEANHQKTKQPQTDQNLINKEANHQKTKQPQTDQNLINKEANHQKTKQPQTEFYTKSRYEKNTMQTEGASKKETLINSTNNKKSDLTKAQESAKTQKVKLNPQTNQNQFSEKQSFEFETDSKNQNEADFKFPSQKNPEPKTQTLERLKAFFIETKNDIKSFFIKNKSKKDNFKQEALKTNSSKDNFKQEALKTNSPPAPLPSIENSLNRKATLEDDLTNKKTKSKSWSVNVENSLLFERNLLLESSRKSPLSLPYGNWSVSIPYTDIELNYDITEKLLFELEVELSYKNQSFGLKLDDLFFKYSENSFFIPFSFQWGKFRMGYIKSNSKIFHKKTLTRQSLYPYGNRALGISLEANLTDSLSVLAGWQAYRNKRETDGFYSLSPSSAVSSYLLYRIKRQNIFAGYLQQDLFLEGFLSAYGVGADLNHSYKNWFFKLKTEFWKIQKTEPNSNILSYYVFPYVKWNSLLGAGWLVGSSQESLSDHTGASFESVVKLDLYFTKSSCFSVERVKEYSSIFTKNSVNFAVKSDFSL